MTRAPATILGVVIAGLSLAVAVGLSGADLGGGASVNAWPRFAPPVIFALMIKWPEAVPTVMVFFVGLIQDLMIGNVLGAGLLALLVTFLFARSHTAALRNAPFAWRWLAFAPFVAMIFLIEWALSSLAQLTQLPAEAAMTQAAATFFVFPLTSVLSRPLKIAARWRRMRV